MNRVDFLISSKDKHTYFNLADDFDTLIEYFNPKTFKDEDFPFNIKDFFDELRKDLETAPSKKIDTIAQYLLKYSNLKDKPLLSLLREEIKNYMIKNPDKLDTRKYIKIIVNSIVEDIQKDLNLPIHLTFENSGNFFSKTYAEVFDGFNTHELKFNENLDRTLSNSTLIFRIYQYLYHEEYHLIVKELANNPNCYKIDILKYAMVHTFREVEYEINGKNTFYKLFYDILREEKNAELFGIKKAKEKILAQNPQFKINILTDLNNKGITAKAQENSMGILNSLGKDNFITQEDYIENLLDLVIQKSPKALDAITAKMYNEDGTRKDLNTLINDLNIALNNTKANKKDVKDFYYYLIYRLIKKMPEEDLKSVLTADNINYLKESLKENLNRLKTELDNIKSHKLYYMMGITSRNLNLKLIANEIEKINNLMQIIEENYLKEENNNVRK